MLKLIAPPARVAAFAIGCGIACATPGAAQEVHVMAAPGMSFSTMSLHESTLNSEQFERAMNILGMDQTQRDAATALFEAFQSDLGAKSRASSEKSAALSEELRDGGGPGVFEDMRKQAEAFEAERTRLETAFLADMKSLLSPEQSERWPKVERMRTRERAGRFGIVSGEAVDLIKIVDQLKPDDALSSALQPTLDQYEVDLDRELAARNQLQDEMQSKIEEAMKSGGMEAMQTAIPKIMSEQAAAGVRVRDVNARYFRLLHEALPDERRAEFDELYRKASFPAVYRSIHAERCIEAAAGFDDLDQGQREQIAAIRESLERDMSALRKELEAATAESDENVEGAFGISFGGDEKRKKSKTEELQDRRRELGRSAMDRLKEVLNDEQEARLPKRDREAEGGMMMFRTIGG